MDYLPASLGRQHLGHFHPVKFLNGKFQTQLLNKSLTLNFNPGDYIFRKNEPRTRSHYLMSGVVEVRDSFFSRNRIQSTDQEADFALDNNASDQSCAIAKSKVSVLVFQKDYVDYLLARSEEGDNKVVSIGTAQAKHAASEAVNDEPDWMWQLINSPLFASIPPANIQEIFCAFKDVPTKAGTTIVKRGEPGDYFYVIKKGRVKIHLDEQNPGDTIIRAAGDYFGDDALVADTARSATVSMLTDGVLAKLDNSHFKTLLRDAIITIIDQKKASELICQNTKNYQLIDVRIAAEYSVYHQDGSQNIPLHHLRDKLAKFDQDKVYMLTAEGGKRSELAAHWMYQSGLKAYLVQA